MNQSRVAVTVGKTVSLIQNIAGWFLTVFFGIGIGVFISETEREPGARRSGLIVCFVFVAFGIFLIRKAWKTRTLISKFKIYVSALSIVPDGDLSSVAAKVGETKENVRINFQKMIGRGYFADAHLDSTADRIVIGSRQASEEPYRNTEAEMVVVKCRSCGGTNRIPKGKTAKCEYCGTYIQGE